MYIKIEGNKIAQLLEIIDRNRWEQIRRFAEPEACYDRLVSNDDENDQLTASDVQVVLFASATPFCESITAMLSGETVIAAFGDPEKAINFCCDNAILNVILDIDPPTDCHQALDVFNALKILNQKIRFFVCTRHKNSLEKDYFQKQGAELLLKPILRKQVKWIITNLHK